MLGCAHGLDNRQELQAKLIAKGYSHRPKAEATVEGLQNDAVSEGDERPSRTAMTETDVAEQMAQTDMRVPIISQAPRLRHQLAK